MVTRADILKYVDENYNTEPEHLWETFPNYEVLRHRRNKKWYAVIMDIPQNKIGLAGDKIVDILDVKCEPEMIDILVSQKGYFPAYHMNKKHWITVTLDGTVADDEIYSLIDQSYEMTK